MSQHLPLEQLAKRTFRAGAQMVVSVIVVALTTLTAPDTASAIVCNASSFSCPPTGNVPMARWRKRLFTLLVRLSRPMLEALGLGSYNCLIVGEEISL